MRKFEKNLKKLLAMSNGGCETIAESGLSQSELHMLSSGDFINLLPIGDNEFEVEVTAKGVLYFENRHKARVLFWADHLANFILGFLSGALVTAAAPMLLELLRR